MSSIEKYLVGITYKEFEGSGVLLPADYNSKCFYILTALHNFVESESNNLELHFFDNSSLEIRYQNEQQKIIFFKNLKYHVFKDDSDTPHDLILLTFEVDSSAPCISLHPIKFYNSYYDKPYDKKSFEAGGYPTPDKGHTSDFSSTATTLMLRTSSSDPEASSERMKDHERQSIHFLGIGFKGISGGGVFFHDKFNQLQLKSIITQNNGQGDFDCIKVDYFIDEINDFLDRENLKAIEIESLVVSEHGSINVNEITNFDVLKSQIAEKNTTWSSDYGDLTNKKEIQKVAENLRKSRDELEKNASQLSDRFAYLALKCNEIGSRRLTTNYLQDAVSLNDEHAQLLLLEKNNRQTKPHDLPAKSLDLLKAKHKKAVSNTQKTDYSAIRVAIKETIQEASLLKDDRAPRYLKELRQELTVCFENDKTLKHYYKYKELGDYFNYLRAPNDPPCLDAFRNHTIALKLTEIAPRTPSSFELSNEIKTDYNKFYSDKFCEQHSELVLECNNLAESIVRKDDGVIYPLQEQALAISQETSVSNDKKNGYGKNLIKVAVAILLLLLLATYIIQFAPS